ncbi:hypothetical protein [Streptomyces sp. ST1015]|uniref:hypothetical protein n=1 Tax=unclassified Streptomyces TaxID=2593676 RepID=UPI00223BC5B4|nr:hypothetical protein [Streptomyces sp. ST1015]
MQHLPGARIGEPLPERPPAPGPVHPHDAVHAGLVRVEVRAAGLHPVRLGQPDRGEPLPPPVPALDDRRPQRLRHGGIDLEHDRSGPLPDPEPGLDLHLPPTEPVIDVPDAVPAGRGVVTPRGHRRTGQRDEVELLDDAERTRIGGDRAHGRTPAGPPERQQRRQPHTARRRGRGQRDAGRLVEDVLALPLLGEMPGDPVVVVQREPRRVHDDQPALLPQHRPAPHHGQRERLRPGPHGGGIPRTEEMLVAHGEQHPIPGPPELHQPRLARPPPVEPQVAGAQALREGDGQEERLVEPADAQQGPPFGVRDEVEEAGHGGTFHQVRRRLQGRTGQRGEPHVPVAPQMRGDFTARRLRISRQQRFPEPASACIRMNAHRR